MLNPKTMNEKDGGFIGFFAMVGKSIYNFFGETIQIDWELIINNSISAFSCALLGAMGVWLFKRLTRKKREDVVEITIDEMEEYTYLKKKQQKKEEMVEPEFGSYE